MSTLIFRLRHVPEDEAQAIRELLDQNDIDWFETNAGNWGIAMPGIWVADDEQAPQARALIDDYQIRYSSTQKELHEKQKQQGHEKKLIQALHERPLRTFSIVIFCLFILYVTIHPFVQMVNYSNQ